MVVLNVEPGQRVRVVNIEGGRQRGRRLMEMGIVPGAEILLVSRHPFKGPLVIKIGNSVLALGRNLAAGIEVEEL